MPRLAIPAVLALFLASIALADAPDLAKVAELIHQLGADAYDARAAAEKALIDIGRAALPAVQAAAQDPDPEVRQRIQAILAAITKPRWQRDVVSAVAEARQSHKPILVFSTIGEPDGWS